MTFFVITEPAPTVLPLFNVTGATKDGVIEMSRWHLKCAQEGTLNDYTRVVNSGVVGGKL